MPHSPLEDQLIVAVIDGGILPESPSFSDVGLGPPPAKWKGICDTGNSSIPFKCNNKIIGARAYYPSPEELAEMPGEDPSPRDTKGHGTHVAAIIAGVPVKNVSMEGVGLGTARGAVPRARIAVYKVCWNDYCSALQFGIEDAIKDGADIISISISSWPWPMGRDGRSNLYFAAMNAGIFVSVAAGNNNSFIPYTVNNIMPWVTTVGNSAGAGTNYVTYVRSGDGKQFEGARLNKIDDGGEMHPLITIDQVSNASDPELAGYCVGEYMNPEAAKGKIVLCNKIQRRRTTWNFDSLNVAGLLVRNDQETFKLYMDDFALSTRKTTVIFLKESDFDYLVTYYQDSNKTGKPATANIAKTIDAPDTPAVPNAVTCRGPNLMDISILKPDLSAPGANLISADIGPLFYNAKTGTSMSTPFASSVAAYVKSFHPTLSPAAIKSALMTTATPMTDPYRNASELAYGTGQVDPTRAADPGLVYDIIPQDYVKHLCQISNSSNDLVYNITENHDYDCAKIPIEKTWTLNYPSFAVPVSLDQPFVNVFQRTVTNVGNSSQSNYKAVVSAPKELTVKVEPSVLAFTQVGQALSYTITIEGVLPKRNVPTQILSAYIVWTDGNHQVRSPIVVFERLVDMKAKFEETLGVPYPQ
jgi:subtilisin family serine protease